MPSYLNIHIYSFFPQIPVEYHFSEDITLHLSAILQMILTIFNVCKS